MSSNLPPTPLPEPRPFERLADSAVDLPKACLTWIPVTLGAVAWPLLGPPITFMAVLGGWWRVLALRQAVRASPGIRQSLLPRAWLGVAVVWGVLGVATVAAMISRSIGVDPGIPLRPLFEAWRLATLGELMLAMLWVTLEAWSRASLWLLGPMAAAAVALTVAAGLQWMIAIEPALLQQRRFILVAIFLGVIAGGLLAPMLISDGVGRVLKSESDEAFERDSG